MKKRTSITVIELKSEVKKALNLPKITKISCKGNLYVVVNGSSGSANYVVKIKHGSKDTSKKIGSFLEISLSDARKKANEIIENFCKEEAEEQVKSPLLDDFIWVWYNEKIKTYKVGSTRPKNLRSLIKIILLALAGTRLNEINARVVCERFIPLNQTANNKHNAISVLIMVLQNAYLKGIVPLNPLTDILKGSESPFKRPPAIGHKWIEASQIKDKYFDPLSATPPLNRYFYLLIMLTGFRFGEVRLLKWDYIDFEKELIVIPANAQGANKTQVDYYKPMSTQVKKLLLNLNKSHCNPKTSFVFKSEFQEDKPICEGSLREPLKSLTTRELDFHGIRKIIRTWLSSKDVKVNVAELTLQHDVRSKLEKTYDKYSFIEEVRQALQMWADYVEKQLPPRFLELINAEIGD